MSIPNIAIGWTTTSTKEEADTIAQSLVDGNLVSCAQVASPIQSHYKWEGKMVCDTEYRITLKFVETNASAIEDWLVKNHSYDTAQWVWIRVTGASSAYKKWILTQEN